MRSYSSYGYANAGGIIGVLSSSTIDSAFNVGSITASALQTTNVGGLSGSAVVNAKVEKSYNLGRVDGNGWNRINRGGIVGQASSVSITNSYFFNQEKLPDHVYQKTLEDMQVQETYVGFDFTSIWGLDKTSKYVFPHLREMPVHVTGVSVSNPEVEELTIKNKTVSSIEISFSLPKGETVLKTNIYLNDKWIGATSDGTFSIDSLTSDTNYTITVKTVDLLGRESKGESLTSITEKSFADKLLDKVNVVIDKLNNAIASMKLWDADTADFGKEFLTDEEQKFSLEQKLGEYKESIGLRDMTDESPTLKTMEPTKVLKIDFNIAIDPKTVIKDKTVFIRKNAEFVDGIDIKVSEDGKTVYILAHF